MFKIKLGIFLLFFIIYIIVMGGHLYSPDDEVMFRTTQSIVERHSFAIEPLLGFASKKGLNGDEYAQYGIGQPILASPLYAIGKFVYNHTSDSFHKKFIVDTTQYHDGSPQSFVLRFFVSLFNQMITALICVMLFSFCYLLTKNKSASFVITLLYGIGTLALPHSRTFFSEPLATLMVLCSLYYIEKWAAVKEKSIWLFIAGGFLGYAILTRMDSVVSAPAVFLLLLIRLLGLVEFNTKDIIAKSKESLTDKKFYINAILFIIPLCICFGIYLLLNKMRYGNILSTGYEDQSEGINFKTPITAGLYGFLFSIGKGIFFFSPPLVLFFFAIKKFVARYWQVGIALLTLILLNLLLHSKWQNWPGGWCWGPRHIYLIHVFLAIPIIALLTNCRITSALRVIVTVLIIIGFAVQLYGASESFIDFYLIFFKTPEKPPSFFSLFAPGDVVTQQVPAPINDSVYIPQNSQWVGYNIMRQYGLIDNFWVNIGKNNK